MAGGIIGELVNGVLWGAGIGIVLSAGAGLVLGKLGEDLKLDTNTRNLISAALA